MAGAKAFVDSSVVLRRILKAAGAVRSFSGWSGLVASELMGVEAARSLDRLHRTGTLSHSDFAEALAELAAYIASVEEAPVTRDILRRSRGSFPTPVATLDAIHIASALAWTEHHADPLVFLTHDRQQAIAARACGLDVHPWPPA